ncbi:hypothetical protein ABFS82_07G050200 [Erythranthe guttata]|uniref:splicing factor U2af large subunit A-like n=1 Tax=Erythranthe guttata TaxID=4155 RepID=UPI00064D80A6|nr:PREDICTED: splicing factor U2af large subunit A-like [Erythranthe guttata]|eukprot:XP_012828601.1 PREDICTED: splicing factor U2af large subunit A-like [Erythranthe guttata]
MTRSRPHREQSRSNNRASQDDFLEGTSARTRPLSFDDIMLRRKNKGKTATKVKNGTEVPDFELAQENIEKAFDYPELRRETEEGSEPMEIRHTSNESKKLRSRRKEEGSMDLDAKSKGVGDKNVSSRKTTEGKNERRDHSGRKNDVLSTVDSGNGSNKRDAIDSYKKGRVSERSRIKSEIDTKQPRNENREVYRKRKPDGWKGSDSENDYKKRNAKDVMPTDKLSDRSREKSEKDTRHSCHNEEYKTRGWGTGKKIDSERKRQEPTRVHLEESRPKRRRSRSRERDKGRSRRSVSHSPKGHKHTSDKREHGEPSSHPAKDRLGREHSDVDKKRLSVNGSSSHLKRNDGPLSGLGGYSPRKRKTDAAAKTPSPTHRSPEKRSAGWDLQPVEKENNAASSSLSGVPTTSHNLSLNVKEFPSSTPPTPVVVNPIGIPHHTLSSQMHAIESIQLTQATRPMRRLYVENLPDSASEKELTECINKFLLSSGINYILGTQPCISCIIHKEKSQALLEFLTPEDASAAISLNEMSFSGSTLKLRRPKDYTNVATGLSDKSVAAVDSISDVVEDSPHKIFIGGISKLISSKMLLEIAKVFGHVKAFHFECIAEINEPYAFLEYADHSVSSKACAGLNGMRLGGQVVTAVFATREAALEENVGEMPLYRIPKHAKPLLEKPTVVLKLKNVLDPEGLLSTSESDLEEILEDIRLESSRFGTVKSVNVAKPTNTISTIEAYEEKYTGASTDACDLGDSIIDGVEEFDRSEPLETPKESEDSGSGNSPMEDELCKPPSNSEDISMEDPPNQENSGGLTEEYVDQQNASVLDSESNEKVSGSISIDKENIPLTDKELESEENHAKATSPEEELKLEANNAKKATSFESEGDKEDFHIEFEGLFEPGSVFVEYRRAEAACMAAHYLNGRIFDGRVVTVGYVDHDLYLTRFRR